MIQIGIDPAFRKNGFAIAIIDEYKEVRTIRFKSFLDFLNWLNCDAPERAIAVVENSNLQNKTFDMSGSKAAVAKKSRNVGANQAISQCAFEAIKLKYGDLAFEVSPKQKGKKWTSEMFLQVLKSEKHTYLVVDPLKYNTKKFSQDEIDAYQLALMGKGLSLSRGAKFI